MASRLALRIIAPLLLLTFAPPALAAPAPEVQVEGTLELLLSEHCGECYSCVRNGNCELQSLSEEYGITDYSFGHPEDPMFEVDDSSYSVVRDMNKCIRCRRCIRTCIDIQEVGVLEAVGRSNKVTIETFEDMPLGTAVCINCGQCVNRCPVGALYAKSPGDLTRDLTT